MEKRKLGNTNIGVSRLCFGSLTMGPLQTNQSPKQGGDLLLYGFENGINFIDAAELYETYKHIGHALKYWDRSKVIVATKSYAYSKETAESSLKKALDEMDTDYVDFFMLHEQESEHTIRGHYEAIEYFLKMKEKGYVRGVGLSTHTVEAVRGSLKYKEIEVIHPIVNINGLGIQDGTIDDMLLALKDAHDLGKGIYGMKPLGGGNLLRNFQQCFDFVLDLPVLDSIAVGMQSKEEIDVNVSIFEGREINKLSLDKIKSKERKLSISNWCERCGKCVEACSHNALQIIDDKVVVDHNKCVLCSYCSKYCPEFCIKVI
ncbi:aldo/keto reductase [Alkaliphilus sp. B6464]|nr:aldo/keto reductase [Alkaliphilus sp. B6464]QUH21659.1 aldo/keto reductase [Alkaliphilus sp. B6464]